MRHLTKGSVIKHGTCQFNWCKRVPPTKKLVIRSSLFAICVGFGLEVNAIYSEYRSIGLKCVLFLMLFLRSSLVLYKSNNEYFHSCNDKNIFIWRKIHCSTKISYRRVGWNNQFMKIFSTLRS